MHSGVEWAIYEGFMPEKVLEDGEVL